MLWYSYVCVCAQLFAHINPPVCVVCVCVHVLGVCVCVCVLGGVCAHVCDGRGEEVATRTEQSVNE